MMKILFYNHTGQIGGAERVLLTILAKLDRGTFDSFVICPAAGPLREMAAERAAKVETVAPLKARFTWRPDHAVRYLISFARVIAEFRSKAIRIDPDLIHANSVRAGLVATVATLRLGKRIG